MPRKKVDPKPKIDTSDWRTLPSNKWNVRTFHAYFADMNREHYGVETYLPMRNWSVEQRMLKNAIDAHGPEILRQAFDECFRTHRTTKEFPILTAGFACSYLINGIIARLQAERGRSAMADVARSEMPSADEVRAWL